MLRIKKTALVLILLAAGFASCKREITSSAYFILPEEGSRVMKGDEITLKLAGNAGSFDSVQYLLDTSIVGTKADTTSLKVPSSDLSLGIRMVTARVFSGEKVNETTTNIVLLPGSPAKKYTFEVVKKYPHDTSAFTQGLEFHDGVFYESDGGYADAGGSSLRKVELTTGKVLKKLDLPGNIFAEGLTLVGDKLIQLTWQNGIGLIYNKDSFEKLGEFAYQASAEGWGLCFDGKRLLKSDGTNRIYFLNKDTYKEEGYIEVYGQNGIINSLNELEWVDGKIYANAWQTDIIYVIDPQSGAVEAEVNLSGLLPSKDRTADTDVLNGIAWDAEGKRLFVTGKNWDTLFQIKLVELK